MKTLKSIASDSALAALSLSAGAYESDFHFGLTWWLARQAGFDLQQSQEIARNNELTDTGMLDAKHAMIWELCIWRNTCASKMTRAMHFRSKTPPPAEPSAREVTEGAVYAEAQSISIIKTPKHEESKVQGWFGQALHGRQDAYSHAGQSDTVWPFCPTEWLWTHPITQGGFLAHDVDQTFRNTDKCAKAALKTYNLMLQYRATMKLGTKPKEPGELTGRIGKFCEAQTKAEKALWFKAEHVPQGDAIAKNTSLKDGGGNFAGAPRIDLRPGPPLAKDVQGSVPEYEQQEPGWLPSIEINEDLKSFLMNATPSSSPQGKEFTRGFLKAALTTPPHKMPAGVEVFWGKKDFVQADLDITKLLRLRLKDQGNADTLSVKAGSVNPDDYLTFTEENWQAALIPVRGSKEPALVGERDGNIVVLAILRNAPNDVLMVEVKPDQTVNIQILVAH